MKNITSSSRRLIYSLLLLVIVASVTLSVVMERTARNIRSNETPLLNSTIPQMRYLADFESAVLRYQLALDKRYTDSITPERFRFWKTWAAKSWTPPRATAPQPGRRPELVHCATATSAWCHDAGVRAPPGQRPRRRAPVLIQMNEDVKRLRATIDTLQQRVEHAIYR
jgi:hypothetical protein